MEWPWVRIKKIFQGQRPEKTNMNLDSIYRLIEETQIFRAPRQSAVQAPCDAVATVSFPREACHSCLPLYGLQPRAAHDVCARSCTASDWDICEELRLRELEEVKARAAQMEKTMRWWSDCTANWRAKWGQVRAERDSAREEGRQLRVKLEMAVKELSALKKKQGLPRPAGASGGRVTQDLKCPSFPGVSCAHTEQCQRGSQTCESISECLVKRELPAKEIANSKEEGLILDPLRLNEEMKLNPDHPNLFKNGGSEDCTVKPGLTLQAVNLPLGNEVPEISPSQVHLDEFQKILWEEREMRSSLEKEIERLESAVSLWKRKYEELKESKARSVDELEKLQAENTSEWHKREILETEKQGLERENRRLKVQVKEMEDLLKRKDSFSANSQGPDFKTSQTELQEKNKELLDLRRAYHKLSRQHQAKGAELTRANDRVEQSEAEAKKLRFRVEGLRQRLAQEDDKLGDFLNQIHKLQRCLDEQKEANENLEIELRHLQNRFCHSLSLPFYPVLASNMKDGVTNEKWRMGAKRPAAGLTLALVCVLPSTDQATW
ncbi:coiled-coil domain-containing protein 102B isoform X1 [Pteropus medius]|uniref:coiled-coil domain-containing protein 102B isoform X1 n=3 Tax=Pteropus vampyrus TaxID=132908 RepID=UPI00196B2EEC|nr:coiled-coil domain-containing protein 102B isoform X1 [Pteropus giganteus]